MSFLQCISGVVLRPLVVLKSSRPRRLNIARPSHYGHWPIGILCSSRRQIHCLSYLEPDFSEGCPRIPIVVSRNNSGINRNTGLCSSWLPRLQRWLVVPPRTPSLPPLQRIAMDANDAANPWLPAREPATTADTTGSSAGTTAPGSCADTTAPGQAFFHSDGSWQPGSYAVAAMAGTDTVSGGVTPAEIVSLPTVFLYSSIPPVSHLYLSEGTLRT